MLVVKTIVKPSELEGLGLFAAEEITKGTPVWVYNPKFDISFEPGEVAEMPVSNRDLVERYAYLSTESGKYVYSIDDSRFMNHSATRNNLDIVAFPGEPETRGVANRDIEAGEEILINYRSFDAGDAVSQEEYLDY